MSFNYIALENLGRIQTGSTPSTVESRLWGGDFPFVTPAELDQQEPVITTQRTLSVAGSECVRKLKTDAVMICCIGSLGKVGIAGTTLATNQQINSVEFDPNKIFPRYGYYACKRLKPELIAMAPATTVAIVSKSKLARLEIPVPPLADQRRIAGILDKADDLRALRRVALAELDGLTKSLFLELFSDTEAANWPRRALQDAYWFQEGPGVRKWQFTLSGVKLLNVGNIEKNGTLNLAKTDRHLAEQEAHGKYKHFLVDAGDLVIASSGISFDEDGLLRTRGAFVRESDLPLCMNTSTIRFKAKSAESDLRFLQAWLDSREFRVQITKLVTGSAQQNFGPTHLAELRITLPPQVVQLEFVLRNVAIESLKSLHRAALADLDTLFASLQHRAFRGEL